MKPTPVLIQPTPDLGEAAPILLPGITALPDAPMAAPPPLEQFKVNILLVDDRPEKLLALEAVLRGLGQNLVQARSGKEALRCLLKQEFAVILLDVSMPIMDGFETAALIRQRPATEHTPIIFVTAFGASDNYISRGYSLGAVDYLMAPVVPEVLRAKVSVFVELHRQQELLKRQSAQLRDFEEARHRRELAAVADRLEAETRRNRFFTLAMDLLVLADFTGRLLQANPSWRRIMGYEPDDLLGRALTDLAHPDDLPVLWQALEQLKNDATPAQLEVRYRHKDGSFRWLRWTLAPFESENLLYAFARDITARKEAEAQVLRLNGELQRRVTALTEANRELEAFNYSIAHDLRTPLRSMTGFSKALLEDETEKLSPLGLEYATRIARSAKYMDSLLLDLLTYSRLARAELPALCVVLDESVRELLSVLEREIKERAVRVEVASPLGTVIAHAPTVKQIVSNLVGNSLKFTAEGRTPVLRIFSTRNQDFVRLWVEDNGIGIAPEYQEKIFGLFQRLHDSDAYPGTGIGLALVRKGAERMGGRTGVESVPGQGSRFWVDLPAAERSEDGASNPAR